jgi:dihydroneopterin aldolase
MADGTLRETSLEASDRIRITSWSVQAAIGAYDHEKLGTQELILDLSLWGDFARAAASDDLADALDYAELKDGIERWLTGRRWNLLEAFGDALCRRVLEHSLVRRVELTVDKPAAQAPALVSYTLIRSK